VQRSAWLGTLTLLLCAGAAASAGCPNTSNTGLLPITAVNIDLAQLLDGANLTCGLGPGQVYQYAAIVNYQPTKATNGGGQPDPFDCGAFPFSPPALLAGGAYPCFTTAPFANLPLPNDAGALPDGGSIGFTVQVYFFSNAAFLAHPDLPKLIASAVTPGTGMTAENKRIDTLRSVVKFAAQAVGAIVIAFLVLGVPSQTTTVLGLAGAGLLRTERECYCQPCLWFLPY